MAIYLKIKDIPGNVTTKGYEKSIELENVHFAAKRNITQKVGKQSDRETGLPNLSEVSITKISDKSSPLLLEALLSGKCFDEATISICRNGDDAKLASQYTLHDVMVSNFEERTEHSNANSHEYLSLSYSKLEKRYVPYDNNGKAQAAVSTGFDLSTASLV